ncbi:major facilitator superfamily domain-containing protein [Tribonema minus]|uniref:Major facilitator superfamily domain-containing protein n=1 Tax=Tribonema minus TaxID=303371 RepID=A0A835ZDZ4_9STRA|nr:major facilitator superfamily domain-containing protein [Tribonema minus]
MMAAKLGVADVGSSADDKYAKVTLSSKEGQQVLVYPASGLEPAESTLGGLPVSGYTVMAPMELSAHLHSELQSGHSLVRSGGDGDWRTLRILQGRPHPDKEITVAYNPLEAGLWHAVHFDKGCYLGQETIAKVNNLNAVKKRLFGFELSGANGSVKEGDKLYAIGEDGAIGDRAGVITSLLPQQGGKMRGLAFIRTQAGSAGTKICAADDVDAANAAVTAVGIVVDAPYARRSDAQSAMPPKNKQGVQVHDAALQAERDKAKEAERKASTLPLVGEDLLATWCSRSPASNPYTLHSCPRDTTAADSSSSAVLAVLQTNGRGTTTHSATMGTLQVLVPPCCRRRMTRCGTACAGLDVSFLIVVYVVLIGGTARGILWPTLVPLIVELGGSSMTVGWSVAAFYIGRIVGSPVLGYIAQLYGVRKSLQSSLAVFAIGALFYALGEDIMGLMITGQLVMGLGTANLGVCRAYVAERSPPSERTSRLAHLTALQYAGLTVTPLLGSFISATQGSREHEWGALSASKFTTPAYVLMALCALGSYLLRNHFEDVDSKGVKPKTPVTPAAAAAAAAVRPSTPRHGDVESGLEPEKPQQGPGDHNATPPVTPKAYDTGFIELQAGVAKSSGVPTDAAQQQQQQQHGQRLLQHEEPLTPTRESLLRGDSAASGDGSAGSSDPLSDVRGPVKETALLVSLLALNVLTRAGMSWHETLGSQLAMSLGASAEVTGVIMSLFGVIGVVSLLYMRVLCQRYSDVKLIIWGLVGMIIAAVLVTIGTAEGRSGLGLFTFFLGSCVVYGTAFPIGNTAVLGYFSKVVGRTGGGQAVMLSWFSSTGSTAKVIFPLIANGIDSTAGPAASFIVAACLETAGLFAGACFMRRQQKR